MYVHQVRHIKRVYECINPYSIGYRKEEKLQGLADRTSIKNWHDEALHCSYSANSYCAKFVSHDRRSGVHKMGKQYLPLYIHACLFRSNGRNKLWVQRRCVQHAMYAFQPRLLQYTFWDTRSQLSAWCRICTTSTTQLCRAQCTLCCVCRVHANFGSHDSRKNILSIIVDERIFWLPNVRAEDYTTKCIYLYR